MASRNPGGSGACALLKVSRASYKASRLPALSQNLGEQRLAHVIHSSRPRLVSALALRVPKRLDRVVQCGQRGLAAVSLNPLARSHGIVERRTCRFRRRRLRLDRANQMVWKIRERIDRGHADTGIAAAIDGNRRDRFEEAGAGFLRAPSRAGPPAQRRRSRRRPRQRAQRDLDSVGILESLERANRKRAGTRAVG